MRREVFNRIFFITVLILLSGFMNTAGADRIERGRDSFKSSILISQFTSLPVVIDGIIEPAWENAEPVPVNKSMSCDLSKKSENLVSSGAVRSLWDGAVLYLMIEVNDRDNFASGRAPADKDSVEVYFDLYNDKNRKYLEDDWTVQISRNGDISGKGSFNERIKKFAVKPAGNDEEESTGYTVEIAVYLGGIPVKNDTAVGMDFCINDAGAETRKCKTRIFWNDGSNKGLDDNTGWGTLKLAGYDGKSPLAIDTYMLLKNIKKAETLPKGIWKSEKELETALADAKKALAPGKQDMIDSAESALERAFKNLRRKGKYPDPMDLPQINHLPDPFTFFNGKKVKSPEGWKSRSEEIKDLAQYYEYGFMPGPPDRVTAEATDRGLDIMVTDNNKTAVITGLLTLPTLEQCGKKGPYPVIVSIDFWAMKPNEIYLRAGYAVLSITYSSAASDNYEHTGAFYTLYPYDVKTGNDAGTLLAWAWSASRGADALIYLDRNNPDFRGKLDTDRLVVTGFSRCGKAALAAGLFDPRFGVVSPGASGCGGAAAYRYESTGNVYEWGVSPGCEVLGDKIRHQGHNSNEMLARFLNYNRIYDKNTHGYGEGLPYDHHEIIAAIAPRTVLITTAKDDYANNAEGDSIGLEGARPVFEFLGVKKNLGFNIRMKDEKSPWGSGGGHWQSDSQIQNLVDFADMIFYGKVLSTEQKDIFYSNPYIPVYNKYYGGLKTMMPWQK